MKKKNRKILMMLTIAIVGIIIIGYGFSSIFKDTTNVANAKEATVYKNPTCGCCGVYITYLRKQGFVVKVENMNSLSSIKKKYQIPSDMGSCHTTVVGDYVIEGHVPVEAINKLLTEKPDITGIALPNMPSGSPGMPGKKQGAFTIYSLNGTNDTPIYTKI